MRNSNSFFFFNFFEKNEVLKGSLENLFVVSVVGYMRKGKMQAPQYNYPFPNVLGLFGNN